MKHNHNDSAEDFLCRILHALKGRCHMTQVSFTANFHITDVVGEPLTVTPDTETFDLAVGVDATGTPVAEVTGGAAPYSFALDPNSVMPDGLSFEEDGNGVITLSGTPTTAGDDVVVLLITDSASAKTSLRSKVGVANKKNKKTIR